MKKRKEFLRVARKGCKFVRRGLVLQFYSHHHDDAVRVGYTVSKRVGNAVIRNRVKRKLREVVRCAGFPNQIRGFDIVLIGRQGSVEASFSSLLRDYLFAFQKCLQRLRMTPPTCDARD